MALIFDESGNIKVVWSKKVDDEEIFKEKMVFTQTYPDEAENMDDYHMKEVEQFEDCPILTLRKDWFIDAGLIPRLIESARMDYDNKLNVLIEWNLKQNIERYPKEWVIKKRGNLTPDFVDVGHPEWDELKYIQQYKKQILPAFSAVIKNDYEGNRDHYENQDFNAFHKQYIIDEVLESPHCAQFVFYYNPKFYLHLISIHPNDEQYQRYMTKYLLSRVKFGKELCK